MNSNACMHGVSDKLWCVICTPRAEAVETDPPQISRWFRARFPGRCNWDGCEERIVEGDLMAVTVDGDYICRKHEEGL